MAEINLNQQQVPRVMNNDRNLHLASAETSTQLNFPWLQEPRFEWLRPILQKIDRAIGNGSRGCPKKRNPAAECSCGPDHLADDLLRVEPGLIPRLFRETTIKDNQQLDTKFIRPTVLFCIPELFFYPFVKRMPCPQCGKDHSVHKEGWNESRPRRVISMHRDYVIICKKYYCEDCKHKFAGYDPRVIERLPQFVQNALAVFTVGRTTIDTETARQLRACISTGMSFSAFRNLYREMSRETYYESMENFLESSIYKRKTFLPCTNTSIQKFSDYNDQSRWGANIPTTKTLSNIYAALVGRDQDVKAKMMMRIKGDVLCGDHTFAIAGTVSDQKQKLFEAMFTVMNENSQVLSYYLTSSTSLKEIEKPLRKLRDRYPVDGGPRLWYTDVCCKDRSIIQDIFPSLRAPDENGVSRVLEDPFHFMNRYPIPKNHLLSGSFMASLREAIFCVCPDDKEHVMDTMVQRGADEMQAPILTDRVRRVIVEVCMVHIYLIEFNFLAHLAGTSSRCSRRHVCNFGPSVYQRRSPFSTSAQFKTHKERMPIRLQRDSII